MLKRISAAVAIIGAGLIVAPGFAAAHDARGVCFNGDALFTAGQYPAGSYYTVDGGSGHTVFSGGFSFTLPGDKPHTVTVHSSDDFPLKVLHTPQCREGSTTTVVTTPQTAPTTTVAQMTTTTGVTPSSTTSPTTTPSSSTSTSTRPTPTSTPSTVTTETTPSTDSSTPSTTTPSSVATSVPSPDSSDPTPGPDCQLISQQNSDGTGTEGAIVSAGCVTSPDPSSSNPTSGSPETTSSPSSTLPHTGPSDAVPFAVAGVIALGSGAALLLATRRRKP